MPLTDTAIRNAKPGAKPVKLFDERGLFLLVTPAGGKWWRLKYRFEGKEKLLSLGIYPDVSLKDARDRRDSARKQLADGIDPSHSRKAQKALRQEHAANSFEAVAREWFAKYSANWVETHGSRILRRLERDIFPHLGAKPIADITAPELLQVVRKIEERGALETAHRALGNCGQVFRYAVATGRATRDPSGDLRGALPPAKEEHFAAVTEPAQAAELLRAIEAYQGSKVVSCALRLAPLVFVRPGELRGAEWAEIDLDGAEWRIPGARMKLGIDHIVPLSVQAVAILREIQPLTGTGRFVFPSARTSTRPMSDNAILAALRRMGIAKDEMSGHGFRAMARTILDEVMGVRPDLIEHQLAHAVRDANGRAYNRTAHLPARREMMQKWADYLEELRKSIDGRALQ
jgi:integrase